MENRVAIVAIVAESRIDIEEVNNLLHEYRAFIKARMGFPYQERGISLISIIIDAPNDSINALTGKLGMINGIKAKTLFA